MKKKFLIAVLLVLVVGVTTAAAQEYWPWSPENVSVWEVQDADLWCVTDLRDDGPHTECYCPCEAETCASPIVIEPTDVPTDTPEPPEPTEKPKCNSGRGNGSEGDPDCDPGNSGGHNQGGD